MQPSGALVTRIVIAYVLAACAGYVCAIFFATSANLIRLGEIGADIAPSDALRTYWFDLRGMAPRWELTRYGTVILVGLAIAFPVAGLIRHFVLRARPALQSIAPFLFPAAGATAIGTALVLMYQQYEVSAVAGGRGLGFLAQCAAGAIAGYLFQRLLLRRQER
jgi:hypothetical protein